MVGYSCARHTAFLCRSLSQALRGHAPFFNFLCLHPVPGTSCARAPGFTYKLLRRSG